MRDKQINLRFWLLVLDVLGLLFILDLPTRATALTQLLQDTLPADVNPTPTPLFDEILVTETALGLANELGSFGTTLATVGPVMLLAALLGGVIAYRRPIVTNSVTPAMPVC